MDKIKKLAYNHISDVKVEITYNEKIKSKLDDLLSKNNFTIISVKKIDIDKLIKEDREFISSFKSYPTFIEEITFLKNGKSKTINFEDDIKNRNLTSIAEKITNVDSEGYLDSDLFITWSGTVLISESINIMIPYLKEEIYSKINKLTNLISLKDLFKHSCNDPEGNKVADSPITVKTKLYSAYLENEFGKILENKNTTHHLSIADDIKKNKIAFALGKYLVQKEELDFKSALENDLPNNWMVEHLSNLLELMKYDNK